MPLDTTTPEQILRKAKIIMHDAYLPGLENTNNRIIVGESPEEKSGQVYFTAKMNARK